jgi:hypothetical protein
MNPPLDQPGMDMLTYEGFVNPKWELTGANRFQDPATVLGIAPGSAYGLVAGWHELGLGKTSERTRLENRLLTATLQDLLDAIAKDELLNAIRKKNERVDKLNMVEITSLSIR